MPFWFWNARLDSDEVERQIREMSDKGVGGFFIHGRFGLQTEYLSDEWMDCVERAVVVAAELGMEVWLYDEYPFPSGVAGGATMRKKANHCRFLDVVSAEASNGQVVELALPDGKLLSAVAILRQCGKIISLDDHITGGKLRWTAPEGNWIVLAFVATIATSPIFMYGSEPNYFESSLTPEFISLTHEAYARRLARHFGKTVKGIFTDEPKMQCIYHLHDDGRTTVWFDDIEEAFREDHGYDLVPSLPALFADVGEDPGRVRRDFWDTTAKRYIERYFRPYREWCETHDLIFTGHLFIEEGLYSNTVYQGDFPKVLSTMHVPGLDHLGLVTDSDYRIPNYPVASTRVNGQKLVTSVAHAIGARRILSETFGCAGWEMTPADMKWIVDWQYSLGVNFLCPHAFFCSAAGLRKADAPPSQFRQATYWERYGQFADYVARLGYALSEGVHKAQIALLYPRTAFISAWKPGFVDERTLAVSRWFDFYCGELPRQHLDYDILTEESLVGATVADGKMTVGEESFELLIVPPALIIAGAVQEKIEQFRAGGGKVMHTPIGASEISGVQLRHRVSDLIRPDLSVTSGGQECRDIYCCTRTTDDGAVFFLANNAREEREVHVSVAASGAPFVCDLETGEITPLEEYDYADGRLEFAWEFPPVGSLLVVTDTRAQPRQRARAQPVRKERIVLSDAWSFAIEGGNVAPLTNWEFSAAPGREFFEYRYAARFRLGDRPDDLWLALDDLPEVGAQTGNVESSCEMLVNGKPVSGCARRSPDVRVQEIDIAGLTTDGDNVVEILIKHSGWAGAPSLIASPALLVGDFALQSDGSLTPPPRTMRLGDWTEHGLPYFSGTGVYTQELDLSDREAAGKVQVVIMSVMDFARLIINGEPAGCRLWPPYAADLTGVVRPGRNALTVKVTNSAANRMMLEKRPSGLMGPVELVFRPR